ncbi:hypothetical protein CPAV1605_636 [seawater metagenome]|uniref:Uncharacterized protein n=1 Tax=seawater metagenome TaxID=1561972 RepID=A0A5E8CI87_9ZZZZ
MAGLGWFAKIKLKHGIAYIIIFVLLWYLFVYTLSSYSTGNCNTDNCKVPTAYGELQMGGNCKGKACKAGDCEGVGCMAGNCEGDFCQAGNCQGENCKAGQCTGKKCKAGDCYGIGCESNTCTDVDCENCKQQECADGRPYDIKRNLFYPVTRLFKDNTIFNPTLCDNYLTKSCLAPTGIGGGSCLNHIYNPTVSELEYYNSGWQKPDWSKPKPEEGEPAVVQRTKIINSKPKVYKAQNCQWCGKDSNLNIKQCSPYVPVYSPKLLPIYDKNQVLKGYRLEWSWIKGSESVCYPRNNSEYVIPCNWNQNPDTKIFSYQHNMVKIQGTKNQYQCTICKRTCSKVIKNLTPNLK